MKDEERPIPQETLRSLKKETPPDHLEQRVLNALKAEGLIQSKRISLARFWWKPALRAMLLLFLFGAGFWMGQRSRQQPATVAHGPLFALFLYEPAGHFETGPGQIQEYVQWVRSVRSSGRIANGEKLKAEGRSMQIRNGKLEIESHPLESRQLVIGGYFLIQAANYEEALRIASSCPHLKYGGIIEVRQIDAT